MTEMSELSDIEFKAAVIKVLQQATIIILETNGNIESLGRGNKGIQLYVHQFNKLEEMAHFPPKNTNYHNAPNIK